ncbi:MAG: histone H1 [Acidobacteria bacterium]|nr:histone H1 [Acidobacteriota bacterium]
MQKSLAILPPSLDHFNMVKKRDENETAFSSLEELLRRDAERDGETVPPPKEEEKDPKAVKAGRKGGIRGGKARAKKLSGKKREQIAKRAARKRWRNE